MQEKRAIPRRAKATTLTVLWAALPFSIYRIQSLPVDALLLVLRLRTLPDEAATGGWGHQRTATPEEQGEATDSVRARDFGTWTRMSRVLM